MKKNYLVWLFLCQFVVTLISCQKKGIDDLNVQDNKKGEKSAAMQPIFSDLLKYYYKGSNNNNIYSGNTVDGINWNSTQVNNGASTTSGPAATVFNNSIYLFHKGRTNNNLYVSSSSDGNNWSSDVTVGNAGTVLPPSACTFNGEMFVAYASATFTTSSPIRYSFSSNGTNWVEIQLLHITHNAPYIFTNGATIFIAYTNSDNTLSIISSTDGRSWSSPLPTVNSYIANHSITFNSAGRACLVFTDNLARLTVRYSDDNCFSWGTPERITTSSGSDAGSSHRPSVVYDNINGRFVAVYKGQTNNNIYYANVQNGAFKERGTANGSTTEAPYLLFLP